MNQQQRIYLDNAATSWPKPAAVYDALDRYHRFFGVGLGRSAYREVSEVARSIDAARALLAELIGADRPERIVFTYSGTDSLNLAIHGLLVDGDHVVTTTAEHNSTLRPLRQLQQDGGVETSYVPCDGRGVVDPAAIQAAIRPNTRLIAMVHASNVSGALQPVEQVGRIAREHDVLMLVDAAQTVGHVPVDVDRLHADLLAAPCHKGLLAPLGVGMLYVRNGVQQRLRTLRQGGTGTRSEHDVQPDTLPEKYEPGNHNVPGLIGLLAALQFIQQRGPVEARRHESALVERLLDGLRSIGGVRIYGPKGADGRVGIVAIGLDAADPQEVAAMLDASCGIQVRAGLHCAPLMHQSFGTVDSGGLVRFSVGPFNTPEQIDAAVGAVAAIAATGL